MVALAHVGDGADAALGVARVEVHQRLRRNTALRVVERLQFGREQCLRPLVLLVQGKPLLLRVVHKGALAPFGKGVAQVVVVPEVVGGQALKKFAQRTGQRRLARTAFAVGEQQRAVALAHMD